MKKRLLAVTLLLCLLVICFVGCTKDPGLYLAPGHYSFDAKSVKFWGGEFEWHYNSFEPGYQEHGSAQSSVNLEGSIECSKIENTYFENCEIDVKIKINKEEYYETIELDSNGRGNLYFYTTIEPTYETNISCKIVDARGIVSVGLYEDSYIKYNNFFCRIGIDEKTQEWVANIQSHTPDLNLQDYRDYDGKFVNMEKAKISLFKSWGMKVVYFDDYIDVGTGRVKFRPKSLDSYYHSINTTKILIFDGDFYLEDFFYTKGLDRLVSLNLREIFPKLETVVIKNMTQQDECLILEETFDLPDSGVKFYINDNTVGKQFTSVLRNTNFVTGIYSFEEFDMDKYRK